jgi:hypothetical protein
MEQMSICEILNDFKSIKLPTNKREFINNARCFLHKNGYLPVNIQDDLRNMARKYNRQFKELHASRERARRTNWKRREGISEQEARLLVERRNNEIAARKADLGI